MAKPTSNDLPMESYPPLESPMSGYSQEPPPPYYPGPSQTQPPSTVVATQPNVQQVVIINPVVFGNKPQLAVCPTCNKPVTTVVKKSQGTWECICTILCCIVLLLIGWLLIPLGCCACSRYKHYCPHCDKHLGTCEK